MKKKQPHPNTATLRSLKATQDTAATRAQQATRRFTASLLNRGEAVTVPRSQKAIQIVINDEHNPLKTHIFKVYPCRHYTYNQAISGRLFYPSFVRINKSMAYFHLLEAALGPEGLTTLAWHEHRYGQEAS